MTKPSIASALIDEMLADVGKVPADYDAGDKSPIAQQRLLTAALEWIYDQDCATALAEFERAASAYTGRKLDVDEN